MRSVPKKYNTLYKKGHVERDMYLPRLDPKGVIQCSGCGAFHRQARPHSLQAHARKQRGVHPAVSQVLRVGPCALRRIGVHRIK